VNNQDKQITSSYCIVCSFVIDLKSIEESIASKGKVGFFIHITHLK
jgi:hypothetical protein